MLNRAGGGREKGKNDEGGTTEWWGNEARSWRASRILPFVLRRTRQLSYPLHSSSSFPRDENEEGREEWGDSRLASSDEKFK